MHFTVPPGSAWFSQVFRSRKRFLDESGLALGESLRYWGLGTGAHRLQLTSKSFRYHQETEWLWVNCIFLIWYTYIYILLNTISIYIIWMSWCVRMWKITSPPQNPNRGRWSPGRSGLRFGPLCLGREQHRRIAQLLEGVMCLFFGGSRGVFLVLNNFVRYV